MNKAKTLILSNENWANKYELPDCIEVRYEEETDVIRDSLYDVVFLDRGINNEEAAAIHAASKAYTLFVMDSVKTDENIDYLIKCKKGKVLSEEELKGFLADGIQNFYPETYGEKFKVHEITVRDDINGVVRWNGNLGVELESDFGANFRQILCWKYNIPILKKQCLDLYLEYTKTGAVEIELVVAQYQAGTMNVKQAEYIFSEDKLKDKISVDNKKGEGRLFIYLRAKGKGTLNIIALHDRFSRRGYGEFLPGGERYVTSSGQEVFMYFDPGNLKPPMVVYFSGYKTKEGFEGYHLIRNLGCPYILISEARLEGGAFYMGNAEYERLISDNIKKHMRELGFKGQDVIMSGISMGTTGALYYSSDIEPKVVVLGKPLANIGTIAANERLFRPGGFPTSLDVLNMHTGGMDKEAQNELNEKLWKKVQKGDYSNTEFAITYMIEDDYDAKAYSDLITRLNSIGVTLYGKGLHGRHNDDTNAIVNWFSQRLISAVDNRAENR